MERDSFIFYRSFYEAIMCINNEDKIEVYEAICNYSLNGIENKFNSKTAQAIFTLIKPNIDNATSRYKASVENGKKGGRPRKNKNLEKPNQNLNKTQIKPNQNLNVDVYEDIYVYEDIKEEEINKEEEKTVLEIASEEFIRLTPMQYEMLNEYEKDYGTDILLLAIKECVKQDVRNFKYLEAILSNWKDKTLEEIKLLLKENKKKKQLIPKWVDQEIKKDEWVISDEDKKRFGIT